MADTNIFDLDADANTAYEPVTVRFRGTEYKLGTTAYGLVAAPALLTPEDEDASEAATLAHIVKNIEAAVRALGPELADAIEADTEVTPGETLVLVRAVMEVLNRIATFRDSNEEEDGGLQPSDDS